MVCNCGNGKFYAHQVCYHEIEVDEDNNFINDIEIIESNNPYGPYVCTKCKREYDELPSYK